MLPIFVCAAVVLSATAPADAARSRLLRRMVVVGDSVLAGFGSGGFVEFGQPGQFHSAPALLARRAHVPLPRPDMERPGVPAQYRIVDANRNRRLDSGEIRRTTNDIGFRDHTKRLARNLAVPGEDMTSLFESISPRAVAGNIVGGSIDGRAALKFLVLGFPLTDDGVTQLSRAREAQPTFLMVWMGNNDVLGGATQTNPNVEGLTPAQFGQRFRTMLDMLADNGVPMAVANLPDPTGIAALRHAAGDVTSCRMPSGAIQPVAADDLLSIDLDPALLPTPPCGKVLDAGERAAITARTDAIDAEIAAAIAQVAQARGVAIAPVDMRAVFDDARRNGVDVNGDGTPDLTTGYLGGIFSLDGVHPTRTANAVIANAYIDAINARFGETIPRLALARVAARDRLTRSRYRPAGEPPFGLIDDSATDDVADFFPNLFHDVENGADDLIDDIRDFFDRIGDVL
jgi:hypothetical protein